MDRKSGAARALSEIRSGRPTDDGTGAVEESIALKVFDVERLREAVAGSGLEHRQLGRGHFQGSLRRLSFGEIVLDSGLYNRDLLSRGRFASESMVIGCILDAPEAGCINGFRFGPYDLVMFPEGTEMHYLVPGHTAWAAVQVPRERLLAEGVEPEMLSHVAVYSGSRSAQVRLVESVRLLVTGAPSPNGATVQALELVDRLAEALRPGAADIESHRRRPLFQKQTALIRRFEETVENGDPAVLRIPDLAAGLGVSLRTLEQVFRDRMGLSPKRYACLLRLNRIYHVLLDARAESTSVIEVARNHGIRHAGRFSGEYRAHFGELPSETLRRR